jgi:hypothetical protein
MNNDTQPLTRKEYWRVRARQYYHKTKEQRKEYRLARKDKFKADHKRWYEENAEIRRKYCKEYYQQNKKQRYKYVEAKTKTDVLYALKAKLRRAVTCAFKRIGSKRPAKTQQLLGCTWQEAKEHFEKLFEEGMNWSNHGSWHIDHIRPCSTFTEQDMHLMNHISNLRPLWAKDNLSKRMN